ncbi:MFS transporter [Streptomyces phaeochromogenes]|uniref:MFS transporter n=1 Tax=Streptomyces phaeochromogenes TaxID=1923 RepID=A0ABZ1H189_STRPH|nr:MFS transporter [Streptomyces phaeochromogenes]WRZ26749.1 MFS transporter [Streptomyces phaeochromogenes]WSD12314.1 MFS transporter [Streptomyces phaeochromogenes]WSJ10884.1 MFS transporter [Streptomyces phaeochromogenes]
MSRQVRFLDTRPLRSSRPFRDLWIGSSAAQLGGQIATVAVLAQVWDLTGSPVGTGAIGLATGLPMVLFGLFGGTLADSVDRRAVVRVTAVGQLLAAAGLLAQALADNRSVPLLLALVAMGTACGALGAPARRTFPVRLLPSDQVAAGLALTNVSFQAAMLAGPALAGLIIARWGFPAAYAAQAVTVAVSMLAVIRLPAMKPEGVDVAGGRRRPERGGWGIILRRPTLWGSMATDLSATLLAMPIALFPLVNEVRFDGNPQTLGLFLSAVAVGGITAGLLSGTVTRWRRGGLVQLTAAGVWGVALAGFGLAAPLWLALGCLAVAGAADTVSVVTRSALVQLQTPDAYRGRVSSVEHVIGVAGPELGNFRGGLLASATSASFSLVAGGLSAILAIAAVAATNAPLRAYRTPSAATEPTARGVADAATAAG